MPKKKKKSKFKKRSSKKIKKTKKKSKIKKRSSKKIKKTKKKSKIKKKSSKKISSAKKVNKTLSSELIFKTKQEWIKNSLANKSQYQNKYNDSLKNNNSFGKKKGRELLG